MKWNFIYILLFVMLYIIIYVDVIYCWNKFSDLNIYGFIFNKTEKIYK